MTKHATVLRAVAAAILSLSLLPVTAAQADEAMMKKVKSNCEMMMKGDMTMKDAMMKDAMMKDDMMKKCDMMMKGEKMSDADMMKMDEMMHDGMMKDDMKK